MSGVPQSAYKTRRKCLCELSHTSMNIKTMDSPIIQWPIFVNWREWPLLWVISVFTLIWIVGKNQWKKNGKLPPGPFGLPVIGNLHMLGKRPYRSLKKLADKYGPIMLLRLGSAPTLVISSSEVAKLILKKYDQAFSSRPNVMVGRCIFYDNQDMGLCEYGDGWRNRRKVCTLQLLTTKRVESMRPEREEEALSMIRKLWTQSQGGSCLANLSEAFFAFPYDSFSHAISRKGFPDRSKELIKLISNITVFMLEGSISDYIPWLGWFEFGRVQRRMKHVFNEFDSFANMLLEEHIALGKPSSEHEASFVDVLLEISESDPQFTHENIKGLILDMVAAGPGTIGATLEWTTTLLLQHPRCLSALQKEIDSIVGTDQRVTEEHVMKMKYLKCVVKESMRLYPTAPLGFPRESTERVVVNGYDIPKGTRLLVNIWAMGRDPNVWDKPDEFIPERFAEVDDMDLTGQSDFKSLPFSAGRRSCPGLKIALPTVLLGIATLVHIFDISLEGDVAKLDMSERVSVAMSRETPLLGHLKLRPGASKSYL